jgi:hypothetical protein
MASKDLHNNIKVTPAINPAAAIAANGTTTSAIIDTQGFESLEMVAQSGVITDGTFTGTLFEGDAANMSDEAAVAAGDLLGSNPVFAAAANNLTKKVGYRGNKRYVRIKFVQAGATTGGFLTAIAVQGAAKNAPVA